MTQSSPHPDLKAAIEGDRAAFARLIADHYGQVYRLAISRLQRQDLAEDLTQEVCIKVGRALPRFREEAQFSTWLYRITLNAIHDHHRRERHHEDIDQIPEAKLASPEGTDAEESLATLWRLVDQLPDKQARAVQLVYGEDLGHREAAEVLECAEGTVSWYISEAKKQLKAMVQSHG